MKLASLIALTSLTLMASACSRVEEPLVFHTPRGYQPPKPIEKAAPSMSFEQKLAAIDAVSEEVEIPVPSAAAIFQEFPAIAKAPKKAAKRMLSGRKALKAQRRRARNKR